MKLPGFLSQNEKLREWLTQFVKFGLVGAANTLLSLGINYLFIWIDPSLYLWGNFVGWAVSVLNAFYWNNRFVFQKSAATRKELWLRLGKSYVSYGASFLLSTLLMWLEEQVLGRHHPAQFRGQQAMDIPQIRPFGAFLPRTIKI